jgi:hypothetical protein
MVLQGIPKMITGYGRICEILQQKSFDCSQSQGFPVFGANYACLYLPSQPGATDSWQLEIVCKNSMNCIQRFDSYQIFVRAVKNSG